MASNQASGALPDNYEVVNNTCVQERTSCNVVSPDNRLANSWARCKTTTKLFGETVKSSPSIALVPLVVFAVLVVAGELQLYFLAKQYTTQKHQEAVDRVTRSAQDVAQLMQSLVGPVVAVAEIVKQMPYVPTMSTRFPTIAANMIVKLNASNAVYNMNLGPFGVSSSTYPADDIQSKSLNIDIFADPLIGAINIDVTSRGTIQPYLMLGPLINIWLDKPINFIIVGTSIFIEVTHNETWGNEVIYEVPWAPGIKLGNLTRPDQASCGVACANVIKDGKILQYWGWVSATIAVEPVSNLLHRTFDTQVSPYKYMLFKQPPDGSRVSFKSVTDDQVLFRSDLRLGSDDYPECSDMSVVNNVATWSLCIVPEDGWSPNWVTPLQIVVPFIAFIVAVLVMFVLLSYKRHERLLRLMLPPKVIQHLSLGKIYAEPFQQVTILFSDIVGYTSLSSELAPSQLVELLNDLYSHFDTLAEKHRLYKVETIGDAFMCVGGAPDTCHPRDAATRVARMGLDMVKFADQYTWNDRKIKIRVGMYTGNVTAAVVGKTMPHWCLIGDAVNVASRMESNSLPQHVHMGHSTAVMLYGNPEFQLYPRGEINIKGKGMMATFFVTKAGDDPPIAISLADKDKSYSVSGVMVGPDSFFVGSDDTQPDSKQIQKAVGFT